LKSVSRYPFLIVGWLWYLGTLVPVIGLIKIGDFAMADRYMYIPLIGPAVIIAWGVPEMLARIPRNKFIAATAAVIALAVLSLATHRQVRIWANSFTLFEHALKVTNDNFFAHYGLGHVYSGKGDYDAASVHFSKAVRINSTKATLYIDLGRSLAGRGNIKDAKTQFVKALEIKPHYPATHFYLANVLVVQNQLNKAIYHFSEALRLHPDYGRFQSEVGIKSAPGYHELVSLYNNYQRLNRDIIHYQKILASNSQNVDALRRLLIAYSIKGNYDNAFALLQVDKSTHARIRDITRGYAAWHPLAP